MTAAALVTGNCVIMKPAEQSSIIASEFGQVLRSAGFPSGSFSYLPGPGSEVGRYLVSHPKVNVIAFTGSKEVGLEIWKQAGETNLNQSYLKHVVCEMGGKNAMIIDSDADLDEAIPAIVQSAFGYQGQKCSALSRLILLGTNYDSVVRRLIEACSSLSIGNPEDPATEVGPVISKAAQLRILDYIEIGKKEARLLFQATMPSHLSGYFVPPTIFGDVPTNARIAREEIFGPVLSVLRADSFDDAVRLANDSEYALTAGVFSRSPENMQRAREGLIAGNVYFNRAITGALVQRQPFGGWKMSGGGTKAGGADYLFNFLYQRVLTENSMRRGFVPSQAASEGGE
jgi:RHH-type proline utilization regulon transcriptional repressor/proline dehydrogenase/delta 1-pyrroline-5-carboxylate dehydrogenase